MRFLEGETGGDWAGLLLPLGGRSAGWKPQDPGQGRAGADHSVCLLTSTAALPTVVIAGGAFGGGGVGCAGGCAWAWGWTAGGPAGCWLPADGGWGSGGGGCCGGGGCGCGGGGGGGGCATGGCCAFCWSASAYGARGNGAVWRSWPGGGGDPWPPLVALPPPRCTTHTFFSLAMRSARRDAT